MGEPDETTRAIEAEISAMPEKMQLAARKLAEVMPHRHETVEWMRALRVDGFLIFPNGSVEARPDGSYDVVIAKAARRT